MKDKRTVPSSLLFVALAGLLATAGCDAARAPADTGADTVAAAPECTACHGSDGNPAPPRALDGKTDTTEPGVGAHRVHLAGSAAFGPIACETCHVVPGAVYAAGHLDAKDGKATLTFSGVALAGGLTPAYDPVTHTCANTYCHGGKLASPGKFSAPTWNVVDGKQGACDACHASPPGGKHPNSTACEGCHAETAGPGLTINDKSKHIDGKVQVAIWSKAACAGCHGAPPVAPHPQSALCQGCHAATVGDDGLLLPGGAHMNGKKEVQLSAAAPCNGCHDNPPTVNNHPKSPICKGCHASSIGDSGQPIPGGTHRDGKKDVVLGPDAPCAACHGNPPGDKHPQEKLCAGCHATTVGPDATLIFGGPHRDGVKDVVLGPGAPCAGCHGNPPETAKHPKDKTCGGCHAATVGGDDKTLVDGGPHRDGKTDVTLGATAPCGACHGYPPAGKHTADPTCGGCHAATVGADNNSLVQGGPHIDGKADVSLGATAPCGACHGYPPAGKHTADPTCGGCHAATVGADNKVLVQGGPHIDGKADVSLGATAPCAACHGYPPAGTHPASTACGGCHAATVGADDKTLVPGGLHMNAKTDIVLGATAPCAGCHGTPPDEAGHPQLVKDCSLCHAATVGPDGKLLAGGKHADGQVQWAIDPATPCASCHGVPPSTPSHPKMTKCAACHGTTVDAALTLIPGGTHANGKVDLKYPTSCDACHGGTGNAAPPPDVNGNTDPTLPTVGAHAAHLDGAGLSSAKMPCESCHVLPATVDDESHLTGKSTIFFPGGISANDGAKPAYDAATQTCSSVYCHGATLGGGKVSTPKWTDTALAPGCESCHALPPGPDTGHLQVDFSGKAIQAAADCWQCHKKTVNADGTLNLLGGGHINGVLN